jgi:hypothetical protein
LLVNITDNIDVLGRYYYLNQRLSEAPTALLTPNTRVTLPGGLFAPAPGAPSIFPCPDDFSGLTPPQQVNCTRGTFTGDVTASEDQIDLSPDPFTGDAMRGLKMRQDIATLRLRWDMGDGQLSYRFGHLDNRSDLEQDGDYSNFPGPPGFVLSLSAFQDLRFTILSACGKLAACRTSILPICRAAARFCFPIGNQSQDQISRDLRQCWMGCDRPL